MKHQDYVHGYHERESTRLLDQANALTELLHHDTAYAPGSRVLEAGCGVGAQTVVLAKNSPEAHITSIDISADSLSEARSRVEKSGFSNVSFQIADVFNLPFEDEAFDHVFVCFVLEHLREPLKALTALKRVLKRSGTLTVIEGDHGSTYFHPQSEPAMKAIQCLIDLQAQAGGNSLIGRELYPIMKAVGLKELRVTPRVVYVDASRPHLVEGFTKNTFTAMVEGVRNKALEAGLIDEETWQKGIQDLYRTTAPDGTFCYTFFKGVGVK